MGISADKIAQSASTMVQSLKGLAKIALSRRNGDAVTPQRRDIPLVILGNGPSLKTTLEQHAAVLESTPLMAVNFAANTPEFFALRPEFYVIADPHFANTADTNVRKLFENFCKVEWPLTLLVPYSIHLPEITNKNITVIRFPAVGIEGARWLRHLAISHRLGMPRPRNVMVCAIMCGIWLGFKEIYITGADHSWTRTLSVSDSNEVVTIQPHYYEEPSGEKERITSVYHDIRLHQILESFSIAFRAYHDIRDYADANSIRIYNATPGSFIDAFERRDLR